MPTERPFAWRVFGWSNLRNAFSQSPRTREDAELRALQARVDALYRASRYSEPDAAIEITDSTVGEALRRAGVSPPAPLVEALKELVFQLLVADPVIVDIRETPADPATEDAITRRVLLRRKDGFLKDPDRIYGIWFEKVVRLIEGVLGYLPTLDAADEDALLTVPLIDLVRQPAEVIERAIFTFYDDDVVGVGLFDAWRERFEINLAGASGHTPEALRQSGRRAIAPTDATDAEPWQLVHTYLGGTPLEPFFQTRVPFPLPQSVRFEHHWIVAGTGQGKTQTLQCLIADDLKRVAQGEASIVVIDSQGDLIRTIAGLKCFAPGEALAGRLCLIDPTDIEYPVALNLFDVGMKRINAYSPLERERLTNSVIELYDFVFTSLLSAELTSKQGVIFRYIMRLMLRIPDANIQTLRELMEPGGADRYRRHIDTLRGTAKAFFDTEFNSPQFQETKRQVVRRLWGILENQTFERMFSHPRNKLDLFSEMNAGKVILINTAKDLLKQTGTEVFGRFFIALIAQAAQERAVLSHRMPTFVYVDECQEYLDQNVALILEQARKFKVGMILAHQYIGQLSSKLLESFAANTSIKFAGGVSDRDARAFSHMLRTTPEFIERQQRLHFAVFARNVTSTAVSLRVPYGVVEEMERMTPEEAELVRDEMRQRYAIHYSEIEQCISERLEVPTAINPDQASSHASDKW